MDCIERFTGRFSVTMRCLPPHIGISVSSLRSVPLDTFSPKPWRTFPKRCSSRAGSVGIAAFNIWRFSAPNPNAPNIREMVPVAGAGTVGVKCTRTGIACGSRRTGVGRRSAGRIKFIRDLSHPANGNWIRPPRGSIFTLAKITRGRLP